MGGGREWRDHFKGQAGLGSFDRKSLQLEFISGEDTPLRIGGEADDLLIKALPFASPIAIDLQTDDLRLLASIAQFVSSRVGAVEGVFRDADGFKRAPADQPTCYFLPRARRNRGRSFLL